MQVLSCEYHSSSVCIFHAYAMDIQS